MSIHILKKTRRCRLAKIIILLVIVLKPLDGKTQPLEPIGVIQRFNSTLLESMQRAKELKFSGRFELLKPIVEESFALTFMAEKSVGRYWKTLEAEQKLRFIEVYTDWSVATYAWRFDNHTGETFLVLSKTESDGNTVTVISQLIKPDGEKIDFHYKLRQIEAKWRIVDIQISGVSQLALTRSQFLNIIKLEDFAALISQLQDKIKVFSGEKRN